MSDLVGNHIAGFPSRQLKYVILYINLIDLYSNMTRDSRLKVQKFCLFVLGFNILINNCSVMSGRSHRFLGINQYSQQFMYLAQGLSTVPCGRIKPRP